MKATHNIFQSRNQSTAVQCCTYRANCAPGGPLALLFKQQSVPNVTTSHTALDCTVVNTGTNYWTPNSCEQALAIPGYAPVHPTSTTARQDNYCRAIIARATSTSLIRVNFVDVIQVAVVVVQYLNLREGAIDVPVARFQRNQLLLIIFRPS